MAVCNEAGAAASQGGGDASLGHKQVSWEEQVWAEVEQASTGDPRRELPPPLQQGTASTSTPLWLPLLTMMGTDQSGDGSPKIRGPGIPPRILLPDGGPLRPPSHLSLSR